MTSLLCTKKIMIWATARLSLLFLIVFDQSTDGRVVQFTVKPRPDFSKQSNTAQSTNSRVNLVQVEPFRFFYQHQLEGRRFINHAVYDPSRGTTSTAKPPFSWLDGSSMIVVYGCDHRHWRRRRRAKSCRYIRLSVTRGLAHNMTKPVLVHRLRIYTFLGFILLVAPLLRLLS